MPGSPWELWKIRFAVLSTRSPPMNCFRLANPWVGLRWSPKPIKPMRCGFCTGGTQVAQRCPKPRALQCPTNGVAAARPALDEKTFGDFPQVLTGWDLVLNMTRNRITYFPSSQPVLGPNHLSGPLPGNVALRRPLPCS